MNYHLALNGKDEGIFSEEELRRRRLSGELTAAALVWREGMQNWQPIDQALGISATPPPVVAPAKKPKTRIVLALAIICGLIMIVFSIFLVRSFVGGFMRGFNEARNRAAQRAAGGAGMDAAARPVTWPSTSLTEADVQKQHRAFRVRQYLDAYKESGDHTQTCDAQVQELIESWIQQNYGGTKSTTNQTDVRQLADKLANTPGCDDPIMLTVAAVECVELYEANHRYERALDAFKTSKYKAYPRLYATLSFAARNHTKEQLAELDTAALTDFKDLFHDGSIGPEDQDEIAEIMMRGWGEYFFERHREELVSIVEQSSANFKWLALVLKGRSEINAAWKARGGGWANSVTAQGWRDFEAHLKNARAALTDAWKLRPSSPVAAEEMMTVELGTTGSTEMRQWFDRAIAAQMDYSYAWNAMRNGLLPRWHGSEQALLAFGFNAVNTGRFDTDVPRKIMDCLGDIETDRNMLPGHHLYGRPDIWPHLQQMYDGYTSKAPAQRDGWRSSYAVIAYLAGHYDVARTQLEKLNWRVAPYFCSNWGKDLSLMPEEVAARTSNLKGQITDAEKARDNGDIKGALSLYEKLDGKDTDEHTKQFIRCRLASLQVEQQLRTGAWVDWLPQSDDDPNWVVARGKYKKMPDGSIEVESGPEGHLIYSRARTGYQYEVQGTAEVIHSSSKSFQAGVVMGLPNAEFTANADQWFSFRIKRNDNEGDVISFGNEWSTKQVRQPVPLNDVTNSFDLRFEDVKAAAVVNGHTIIRGVQIPGPVRVCDTDYLMGIGAYNDMNDTMIRYRALKIRVLPERK